MSIKVAVEGCCHGELNTIYLSLRPDVDLLIICGDFQAIRNSTDLETLNVPKKYLRMGDFHQYYLGEKSAPVLTIFVGGNHECLLYLRELQFGGWVAPNIYYLGEFGVLWYRGLRISGLSGIWNYRTFSTSLSSNPPKYTLPYLDATIKTIYHVKPKNYLKFVLSGPSDIAISHDWPQWVWKWGDSRQLLRHKPYFRDDMESGRLGSPLAGEALAHLKPRHWFSLHLHTRFTAVVQHQKSRKRVKQEPKPEKTDEISLDMDDFESGTAGAVSEQQNGKNGAGSESSVPSQQHNESGPEVKLSDGEAQQELKMDSQPTKKRGVEQAERTHFLALDKCLPRKRFLEFLDIEPLLDHQFLKSDELYYDARGLAIQKVIEDFVASNPEALNDIGPSNLMHVSRIDNFLAELDESVSFEVKKLASKDLQIPRNFEKIAPDSSSKDVVLQYWMNNQTEEVCESFKIPKPNLNGV